MKRLLIAACTLLFLAACASLGIVLTPDVPGDTRTEVEKNFDMACFGFRTGKAMLVSLGPVYLNTAEQALAAEVVNTGDALCDSKHPENPEEAIATVLAAAAQLAAIIGQR